jgi:hypothetical protein
MNTSVVQTGCIPAFESRNKKYNTAKRQILNMSKNDKYLITLKTCLKLGIGIISGIYYSMNCLVPETAVVQKAIR